MLFIILSNLMKYIHQLLKKSQASTSWKFLGRRTAKSFCIFNFLHFQFSGFPRARPVGRTSGRPDRDGSNFQFSAIFNFHGLGEDVRPPGPRRFQFSSFINFQFSRPQGGRPAARSETIPTFNFHHFSIVKTSRTEKVSIFSISNFQASPSRAGRIEVFPFSISNFNFQLSDMDEGFRLPPFSSN